MLCLAWGFDPHTSLPTSSSQSEKPEPRLTLLIPPACSPSLPCLHSPPLEGLTYVAALASGARGAQAYDMSLRLLARPSATGLLSTGPGGGCNPQGEAEHEESSPLGCSTASQTLRLGHVHPRPHEADFGSACFWQPCLSWTPSPSVWERSQQTGRCQGCQSKKQRKRVSPWCWDGAEGRQLLQYRGVTCTGWG